MTEWFARLTDPDRPPSEVNTPWINRRVYMLSRHLASAIPTRGTVLDVGAGDGRIGKALMRLRPDLKVEGLDTDPHPDALINVMAYDGGALPLPDKSVDYVTMVDVLHFTDAPAEFLRDAARVARQGVAIKGYLREGFLAGPTLAALAGNGDFTFLTRREWQGEFFRARLEVVSMNESLGLHLPPASWLLDRRLHFVAYLTPKQD